MCKCLYIMSNSRAAADKRQSTCKWVISCMNGSGHLYMRNGSGYLCMRYFTQEWVVWRIHTYTYIVTCTCMTGRRARGEGSADNERAARGRGDERGRLYIYIYIYIYTYKYSTRGWLHECSAMCTLGTNIDWHSGNQIFSHDTNALPKGAGRPNSAPIHGV